MDILFSRRDTPELMDRLGLQPLEIGLQACTPGHAFGPAIRDGCLLHFIYSGSGLFRHAGHTSRLTRGDGFLIRPCTLVQYEADRSDPWTYGWMLLSGDGVETCLQSCGLTEGNDIFHFDPERTGMRLFQECLATPHWQAGRDLVLLSAMMRLLAEVRAHGKEGDGDRTGSTGTPSAPAPAGTGNPAVERVIRFIHDHGMHPLSLKRMASEAGLHPGYLCEVFRRETGRTPHAYLAHMRMTRACVLLRDPTMRIADIARSVGYEDPLHFSRMFRRQFGLSPEVWRRKQTMPGVP